MWTHIPVRNWLLVRQSPRDQPAATIWWSKHSTNKVCEWVWPKNRLFTLSRRCCRRGRHTQTLRRFAATRDAGAWLWLKSSTTTSIKSHLAMNGTYRQKMRMCSSQLNRMQRIWDVWGVVDWISQLVTYREYVQMNSARGFWATFDCYYLAFRIRVLQINTHIYKYQILYTCLSLVLNPLPISKMLLWPRVFISVKAFDTDVSNRQSSQGVFLALWEDYNLSYSAAVW